MPYYVNTDPGTLARPGEIEPSQRVSFAGAVGSALTGNISSVIADYAELQQANQGPRVGKTQADLIFKEAGIKHSAPQDGYTQSAIDIIVKRQRNQQLLRQVDEATPYSWIGTPIRGGASILTGLSDPLNVASGFVPVVREARIASMLARTGESGLARAFTRGVIGATEGFVGSVALEAPTYGLRTALQDDYTLTDSLVNMAFGTAAGGGLHSIGGAIGDSIRGGGNPYSRFAGLGTKEIRQVLEFEAGKVTDTSGFTALQRRAAGLEEADTVPVAAIEQRVLQEPVERARQPLAELPDAPFQRLYELTPEQAYRTAGENLREQFRSELLATASQRAEPRAIVEAKQQIADLETRIKSISGEGEFKRQAKELQKQGQSRKQAESSARNQIEGQLQDLNGTKDRLQGVVDGNARAAQAEQQIAELDKGNIPEQFEQRVRDEAASIQGASDIARAITGNREPPAAFIIGMAQPETREAAMRTAIADFANGRMPDVEAVVRSDPTLIGNRSEPKDIALTAQRQRGPDAAYLGSREASEAATVKQKEGPLEIENEVQTEVDRLENLKRNLEANGIPREELDRIADLSVFDEEIKRAASIGEVSRIGAICGIRA